MVVCTGLTITGAEGSSHMQAVFSSAFGQMITLFGFMAIGYFLRISKRLGEGTGKTLSNLELYLFCPCLSLITFSENCTRDTLLGSLPLLGVSCVILLVMIPLSRIMTNAMCKTDGEKAVYRYSLLISNYGYLGYPIIGAVFGDKALMDAMIFCIPITFVTYTYGMYVLIPGGGFSFKKLLNPPTIALSVGLILGLTEIRLPAVLGNALQMGSNCMAPAAMLLTGFILAGQPIKNMLHNYRAYIGSVLRLVVIPLLILGVMFLLNIRGEVLLIAAVIYAMPMGLNPIVFPEAYGGDATSGAQSTFISNIFGIITLPLMVTLIHYVAYL